MRRLLIAAALVIAGGCDTHQGVREHIHIVGSSTVYPFSTVVAEQFGQKTPYPTPLIESTGSGGGIKLFCAGEGFQHPDIANSSRRIKASEVNACASNSVDEIIEVNIGFDGIVMGLARESEPPQLERRHIFLALAAQVPDGDDSDVLIENPYERWSEIDGSLPDWEIRVFGPPPTSGTRDAFVELAMEGGCKTFSFLKALSKENKGRFRGICHTMREDGRFVEAGENDNLIVKKLNDNPRALGIFGYSFLDQNNDRVQAAPVDGVGPSFQNIANGSYPISRPLYFYVKKSHVRLVQGLPEFLAEFTSEDASGEFGYLSYRGLIPLPDERRVAVARQAADLRPLELPES
ncbi:MAG: substrate-binding domain-containing protein [Pseudomonadota bacterium]